MTASTNNPSVVLFAKDHLDPEGSVVKSGVALADAVIRLLEDHGNVVVNLDGVKGASSSYFNVFLRRVEEAIGIVLFEQCVTIETSSRIQRMVYSRSVDSLRRGPKRPTGSAESKGRNEQHGYLASLIRSIFGRSDSQDSATGKKQ